LIRFRNCRKQNGMYTRTHELCMYSTNRDPQIRSSVHHGKGDIMVTNIPISTLSILQDHKQGPPLTNCATSTSIHTNHVSEFKIKVSLNSTVLS